MSVADCELLTDLYALRGEIGSCRVHAQRLQKLTIAADLATAQESVTKEIDRMEAADNAEKILIQKSTH